MKQLLSVGTLLGSFTTIFCCLLPAVFAAAGFGAVFASFISAFPTLIWLSEHKIFVFSVAALLLVAALLFQLRAKVNTCPLDPTLAEGCRTAKGWSKRILLFAAILYFLGFSFAFVFPKLLV